MSDNVGLIFWASETAHRAHKHQFRRDGKTPYYTHLERVADRLAEAGESDEVIATAWLHDVLEDTQVGLRDVRDRLPTAVYEALYKLTKNYWRNLNYMQYVEQVARDPIARKVKIADILDNLTDSPTPRQIRKYAAALLILVPEES